jgi:hypothetical protein
MISNVTRFFDFKNKDFFVIPKPKENELLSSWLCRIAYAHHTVPTSFLNLHFKEYGLNILTIRDIDIWLEQDLLNKISKKSHYASDRIYQMTLKSYEGKLLKQITSKTRNNLIMSLGNRASYKYKKGLRFCPLCLKEHGYYKKEWRLGFYTVCLEHNITMHNCCYNCNTPINILRSFKNLKNQLFCYKCGSDYRDALVEKNNDSEHILFLMELLHNQTADSIDFFNELHKYNKRLLWFWRKGEVSKEIEYFYNTVTPYQRKSSLFDEDYDIKHLHQAYKYSVQKIRDKYEY